IETTDTRGNPVSGELTLWAVDQAIFVLVDDRPKDIFKRFWHNRYNGTVTKHSLQGISFAGAGEMGGCFAAGTKILMADGTTKPIEDVKPGEMILTFKSEQELKLLPAQVTSVQKAEENSYLLINGFLKITSDHILWINLGP
ncbi:MAG: hypothetical protein P8107_15785, partial [Spirochaetia bacterium]